MTGFISDIVSMAGRALEVEDRELRIINEGRGKQGEILRIEWERYYQYILWKSIVPKYDAEIKVKQKDGFFSDLEVYHDGVEYVFEMKYWKKEHLLREIKDIEKLAKYSSRGVLLLFSENHSRYY